MISTVLQTQKRASQLYDYWFTESTVVMIWKRAMQSLFADIVDIIVLYSSQYFLFAKLGPLFERSLNLWRLTDS